MALVTKDLLLSGHSLFDYRSMFDLTTTDLTNKILTCASGFDSFNAQMYKNNKNVVSCARSYSLSLPEMQQLVENNLKRMQQHLENNQELYCLDKNATPHQVIEKWHTSAKLFLDDYELGRQEGRYRADVLPNLDFADASFKLCLCSHFLFASHELSDEAHVTYLQEMARVAAEVRIFPLADVNGEISPLLGPVMLLLQQMNFGVEVREVAYEFQHGSNAMLRVWSTECPVE